METPAFNFLLLFILLLRGTSGSFLCGIKAIKRVDEQTKHSYRRKLIQTIQHDFINPPITTYPTTPVTNPVTYPTTPVTNPVNPPLTAYPTTPVTNPPLTTYPTTPVTNPVTTPNPATVIAPPDTSTPPIPPATSTPNIPVTFPPITDPINPPTPVTNPVTTPSTTIPGGQPVVAPPAITNAPAVPGQSWCVARGGLPETTTQVALDYACGLGGVDCSAIQQSGSCYNPNTLQNHASYAFNSYYQKNPMQTSCDFGGAAMITNINPSAGSCVFTTSSSSSTSPIPVTTPTTPTPTTESSSGALPSSFGTPPNALSASSPAFGGGMAGYGESPPTSSISKASMSRSFRPLICCIFMVISIIIGRIDFNI